VFCVESGDGIVEEEKAMGELAPTFVTLGTSCHLRMNKDHFCVCVCGGVGFEGHMCT